MTGAECCVWYSPERVKCSSILNYQCISNKEILFNCYYTITATVTIVSPFYQTYFLLNELTLVAQFLAYLCIGQRYYWGN